MRAFRIAYDGRPFHGFQRQPDVPTVEDELFCALRRLDVCGDEPRRYSAAGRTDAGVSAVAQTVAFECPAWCSPSALDAELHDAIRAWASADVEPGFHATGDATRRVYRYHLHAPDADDGRARAAADQLSGEHDFHNLTPDDRGTVREVEVAIERDGAYLVVTVASGGFPRQLVRRLVSLLDSIAAGEDEGRIDRILSPDPVDGPDGVAPAPAYPLVLADVAYPTAFAVDPDARDAARAAFERRREERRTRARVAGTVLARLG